MVHKEAAEAETTLILFAGAERNGAFAVPVQKQAVEHISYSERCQTDEKTWSCDTLPGALAKVAKSIQIADDSMIRGSIVYSN